MTRSFREMNLGPAPRNSPAYRLGASVSVGKTRQKLPEKSIESDMPVSYSEHMASNIDTAKIWGITYRTEDYRTEIVLMGDRAILRDEQTIKAEAGERLISIEEAWTKIARMGLKLASSY